MTTAIDRAPALLDADELRQLTGRTRADAQIAALRRMGIAFWINAANKPVVARATLTGGAAAAPAPSWEPRRGTQAV